MLRSRLLRPGVFALAALLVGAPLGASPSGTSSPGRSDPRWTSPVAGFSVVEPWGAPAHRYAPGHRGIDLAAAAGQPVVAVAAGTVSFSGRVVDRSVVSIVHADGLVSTVEPVDGSVTAGQVLTAGQPVGAVGAGGHCDGRCVHLGVREGGDYVSPMRFFGGIPRAVLLPMDDVAQGLERVARKGASGDSRVRSGAGVGEAVGVADPLGRDVGVDLRGAQARVAE
ncbi:peptidase M23 [Rathayibacter sp. AY1D1]|uniref:murein hydrolase activator EnvC family protein n=1 Tax=Rathayibacter sp. AY1D1 TaxID=2080542 RepID=UPI000CE75048|nr:M23 family metallopeptidase [Rathayibacter sp. AY1D1]PPI00633.1 peptidase M23 [Rathayibacter sp. AY1D1]